jgi:transcriptional regulator with XRE-family HTH domain
MTPINPERLRYYRKQQRWSMQRLADEATVNKCTIQRIERGDGGKAPREHTITKLARALQVSTSELTDQNPVESTKHVKSTNSKSQINARIGADARNALAFISARYGVKQATILRLAPLLFALVAEESLVKRSERLEKLSELGNSLDAFPRAMEQSITEFCRREYASIEARDIFGTNHEDEDVQRWQHTDYADHVGICNPLALHIRQRVAQTSASDKLVGWDPDHGPDYHVGSEIALEIAAGDEEIADMLLSGAIGVHEIPSELRNAENPEARIEWLRHQRDRVSDERNKLVFFKRLNLFGDKDKSNA